MEKEANFLTAAVSDSNVELLGRRICSYYYSTRYWAEVVMAKKAIEMKATSDRLCQNY